MWLIGVFSVMMILIVLVSLYLFSDKKQDSKLSTIEDDKKVEMLDMLNAYRKQRRELVAQFGNPDSTVVLKELSIKDEITVFRKSQVVMILGKPYSFSDLSGCTHTDNQRILKGDSVFVKSADSYPVDEKSSVEASSSESGGKPDIITHSYTVVVHLKGSSNADIKIPMGSNTAKVNELFDILNTIINSNLQAAPARIKEDCFMFDVV